MAASAASAVAQCNESSGASAVAEYKESSWVYHWPELVSIASQWPVQEWRLNSQALKYARHLGEEPAGVLKTPRAWMEFELDKLNAIGAMEHDKSGPGFTFASTAVAGNMVDWSPAQFLTQLRSDTLKNLELKTHGVQRLVCLAFENTVDKMRLHAAKQGGQPFEHGIAPPIWDFVLTRGDGVMFAMHPSWSNFKCKVSQLTDSRQLREQLTETRKLRDWVAQCYPIRGHGLYQEGQDPIRDVHRKNHLASKGVRPLAVAGQSEQSAQSASEATGESAPFGGVSPLDHLD